MTEKNIGSKNKVQHLEQLFSKIVKLDCNGYKVTKEGDNIIAENEDEHTFFLKNSKLENFPLKLDNSKFCYVIHHDTSIEVGYDYDLIGYEIESDREKKILKQADKIFINRYKIIVISDTIEIQLYRERDNVIFNIGNGLCYIARIHFKNDAEK